MLRLAVINPRGFSYVYYVCQWAIYGTHNTHRIQRATHHGHASETCHHGSHQLVDDGGEPKQPPRVRVAPVGGRGGAISPAFLPFPPHPPLHPPARDPRQARVPALHSPQRRRQRNLPTRGLHFRPGPGQGGQVDRVGPSRNRRHRVVRGKEGWGGGGWECEGVVARAGGVGRNMCV